MRLRGSDNSFWAKLFFQVGTMIKIQKRQIEEEERRKKKGRNKSPLKASAN